MSDCPPGCLVNFNISRDLKCLWYEVNNEVLVRIKIRCSFVMHSTHFDTQGTFAFLIFFFFWVLICSPEAAESATTGKEDAEEAMEVQESDVPPNTDGYVLIISEILRRLY